MSDTKWPEGEYTYTAPDGTSYDSPKDYVWIGIMGMCGCRSESLYDLAFYVLKKLYDADQAGESWYYEHEGVSEERRDLQELILHVLDGKDLIEHGTAIRGSWLTDYGRTVCMMAFEDLEKK